jgi:hypothetical protein
LLLVRVGLSAAPGDSGLLGYTDNNPFYALFTALTAREDSGLLGMGKISFHTLFTVLDLLVWAESASSQSSLFSSFSQRQPLNLENLPQTEFTFSHVGSTAGMEWKSYSPDTGPTRSSRQKLTARFTKFVSQVLQDTSISCEGRPKRSKGKGFSRAVIRFSAVTSLRSINPAL